MGETEIRTAAAGDVKVQSPQEEPKPKSAPAKRAGTTAKASAPVFDAQGRPVTNWDDPAQDPNLRVHVGDSPDGEANRDFKAGKDAVK